MTKIDLRDYSVSHGTMREEDLIPRFCELLEVLDGDRYRTATMYYSLHEFDTEASAEFLDILFCELDSCAPYGYYFGAHPGDGSDFGFWKMEDDCNG